MLAAISELASVAPAIPETAAEMDSKSQDAAERRQVTVMFSDLVGSTALSGRLDPEDLRDVISAYQKCVAETVRRFDGFVAKYMGDGVLIYFGYPQAHEDDAERAVRSGLDLITAVARLKTHEPLQTRVGIATGLVVVGDLIGSGEARERGIVGETPNLAARLQGIARPNMVVIAESTRKLLGNLFELEEGPRRAYHAQIAEALESQFPEIAESQPELLAHHCSEAGQIENAAGFWGKAGQRSLARSALMEAVAQLSRALDQIAVLPATAALRGEEIKLQVGLVNALMHTRGHASPETKGALNRARLVIERGEALGEPPEDPLLLL
jgi:class 3 adenylate cyclase